MGYKILLADDSVTVQKIITLTFSDEGVDVLTVNNGDEALHRLQYLRPALVMADVSIPGKNGYEICEFVKNHPEMKDTPVVLLVPAFEPFDEERARRIGANQHLTKPFQSIRTLISTVKGLLENNPPKITTPLTNSGALSKTGSLPKTGPLAKSTGQLAEAAAEKIEQAVEATPSKAKSQPVQDTQPFPPEMEEDALPTAAENVLNIAEEPVPATAAEDVLSVESEPSSLEPEPTTLEIRTPEPAEAAPLELAVEKTQIEEEPTITTGAEPIEMPASEPVSEAPVGEPLHEAAPTPVPAAVTEVVNTTATNSQQELAGDLDHVLDLDDVLPEIWPQPAAAAIPQADAPPVLPETDVRPQPEPPGAIPQAVIDEIVNRVVAQLSEKLAGSLAAQLAPEVAELVKHQAQHEPLAPPELISSGIPSRLESDSLLDLD